MSCPHVGVHIRIVQDQANHPVVEKVEPATFQDFQASPPVIDVKNLPCVKECSRKSKINQ